MHLEVAEGGDGPGILVFCDEISPGSALYQHVQGGLHVGFDTVDATRREKAVEIIKKLPDVFFGHKSHLVAGRTPRKVRHVDFRLDRLVLFGDLAARSEASPVADYGVPDCDMFDSWVPFANLMDGLLEAARESISVGFEGRPAALELALAWFVEGLPVIINDQTANVNPALCQGIDGVEKSFLGQLLS